MSHTPHEFIADFPELAQKIALKKSEDAHFASGLDAYHLVNKQVHRAETDIEPIGDQALATLRKERMLLKDTLYQALVG